MKIVFMMLFSALIIWALFVSEANAFTKWKSAPKDEVTTTTIKITLPSTTTSTVLVPGQRIALHWEDTGAGREAWSKEVTFAFRASFSTFDKATDWTRICPKYKSLAFEQKIEAMGEFWAAVAFYESSYNPASASVDVGTEKDKGSWSVGLYQVSANDGPNTMYGYTFETLKDPIKNIRLATEILKRQVANTGLLILPNSSKHRYWAILLEKNRYSKIPEVIARTKKHAAFCL